MYSIGNIPWTPTDLELYANKYNNTNNSRVQTSTNLTDLTGTYACYVFVNPGEVYRIYGKGDSGAHQLYAMADSDRYVVTNGKPGVALNTRTTPLDLVIPEGVARLVVNLYQYDSSTDKVQKIGVMTPVSWNDGTGDNIYLTRQDSAGDQTVLVSSDSFSGYIDRTKNVTFTVIAGETTISETLTVVQTSKDITIITREDVYMTDDEIAVGYE